MPSISTRNWAFSLLCSFLLSADINGVEIDSSPEPLSIKSWTDLIQPVTALLLPPPALSGSIIHMREATSIIGRLTEAAIQSPENQSRILGSISQRETERCYEKTSKQIRLEQRMLTAQTKASQGQLEALRTNLEGRLDFVDRQCQYMIRSVDGDEEGFKAAANELKRTALSMTMQAEKLEAESENVCNEVNQTLDSLYSRLARADDNVAELRDEYEELVQGLKMVMAENIEQLTIRITELSKGFELESEESVQLTIEDINSVTDQLNELKMSLKAQFAAIDKSIVRTEEMVVNRLQEMNTQWAAKFQGISTSQDIKGQLNGFQQSFLNRINELQVAMIEVQSTSHQQTKYIDHLKSLVHSWTKMMERAAGDESQHSKHRQVNLFKRRCQKHDPLSLVAWIQQNITDTVKRTSVPEQSYQTWRHRLLSLKTDAFLMHAACLSSAQGIYGYNLWGEIRLSFWQLLWNNYLRDATSTNRLHYARWWNQNIKKSGLVSQFETKTQAQLESTFVDHADWVQSSLETQPKMVLVGLHTPANTTVTVEALIDAIDSNQTFNLKGRAPGTTGLHFCCKGNPSLCEQVAVIGTGHNDLSDGDNLPVCFELSLWLQFKANGSVLVIAWWPVTSGVQYHSIPDNIFIQHDCCAGADSTIGFAIPDLASHNKTSQETKESIEIMSEERWHKQEWYWLVVLTDHICWWKQDQQSQCSKDQCQWEDDTGLSGTIMEVKIDTSRDKCCHLCSGTEYCIAASWSAEEMICMLYSEFSNVETQPGWKSVSKLKDCTQCTNTIAADASVKRLIMDDTALRSASYSILQDIARKDCAQGCVSSAPVCLSYSWTLTGDGAMCQINDKHGTIEEAIGSTLGFYKKQ